MVAHPQESAPSSVVAAAVRQSGGPRALAELIEVERARPRGFRDVTSATEAYDLLLDREVVGQVIHDETRLHGMPQSPKGWVLVQRDADYSLAAEEPGTALAKARAIVAERLAETAENPSAVGQIRRPRARFAKALPILIIGLALAVVVVALLARARR